MKELTYGFFIGGDPRNFKPDYEVCTEKEIQKWKNDCQKWNDGDYENVDKNAPRFCGEVDGKHVFHLIPGGYGLGVTEYEWEELE